MLVTMLLTQENAQYTCCMYKDDVDNDGCVLEGHDWIKFSEENCVVWSHVQCLEKASGGFICAACQNVFI